MAAEKWVLDCFNGGVVMDEDEAARFIVARLGRDPTGCSEAEQLSIGKSVLASLRAAPQQVRSWVDVTRCAALGPSDVGASMAPPHLRRVAGARSCTNLVPTPHPALWQDAPELRIES